VLTKLAPYTQRHLRIASLCQRALFLTTVRVCYHPYRRSPGALASRSPYIPQFCHTDPAHGYCYYPSRLHVCTKKCYMGFCTPRRTVMDSKKKTSMPPVFLLMLPNVYLIPRLYFRPTRCIDITEPSDLLYIFQHRLRSVLGRVCRDRVFDLSL